MTIVTFGGVTIGLALLLHQLVTWWPGLKPLQKRPLDHAATLAPFLIAWAYGVLAILTIGGVIGWAADTALWITSWLGDAALVWGVGGTAGSTGARPVFLPLTQAGGGIVLILTVCILAAAKKSRHGQALGRGAWCGIALGTSSGVAGFAAVPLAQAVNWCGSIVYGVT
jgi:hypothetical protein